MHVKLLQKFQFKKQQQVVASGGLIGNKIANKITKISRSSPQNSIETVKSETKIIAFDREIPKERHISPEKNRKLLISLDYYNNIVTK